MQDVETTIDQMPRLVGAGDLAAQMSAERDRASVVRMCRKMYKEDPRAKRIVSTLARDAVRGGFTVKVAEGGSRAVQEPPLRGRRRWRHGADQAARFE